MEDLFWLRSKPREGFGKSRRWLMQLRYLLYTQDSYGREKVCPRLLEILIAF